MEQAYQVADSDNDKIAEDASTSEQSSQACKRLRGDRAVERALSRAAERELKINAQEEYAKVDAAERALRDSMREARNEAADEHQRKVWEHNISRELESAQARATWVDKHFIAVAKGKAARQAERAFRAERRQQEREAEAAQREARNQAADEHQRQVWERNVARELDAAEARATWVDKHAATNEAKKSAQTAIRDAVAIEKAEANQRREELRAQRNAESDDRGERLRALATERELARVQRYKPWTDAHGVTIDEGRAAKQALRERRQERAKTRAERRAAIDAARDARNAAADARSEAIRKAANDHAVAAAFLREAQRTGSAKEVAQASLEERRLRKIETQVRESARVERNEAADKAFYERLHQAQDEAYEVSCLRESYNAARADEKAILRQVKQEHREARKTERPRELATEAAIRAERNTSGEARGEELRELNIRRETRASELREGYLNALQDEKLEWRDARKASKAASKKTHPDELAQDAAWREARNAAADERDVARRQMYTDRELEVAELRRDYLDARSDEIDEWKRAKAASREVRRQARPGEIAAAAAWREARNAAADERSRKLWQIAEEREYVRALERERARNAAHAAWRDMREEQSKQPRIEMPDGIFSDDTQ